MGMVSQNIVISYSLSRNANQEQGLSELLAAAAMRDAYRTQSSESRVPECGARGTGRETHRAVPRDRHRVQGGTNSELRTGLTTLELGYHAGRVPEPVQHRALLELGLAPRPAPHFVHDWQAADHDARVVRRGEAVPPDLVLVDPAVLDDVLVRRAEACRRREAGMKGGWLVRREGWGKEKQKRADGGGTAGGWKSVCVCVCGEGGRKEGTAREARGGGGGVAYAQRRPERGGQGGIGEGIDKASTQGCICALIPSTLLSHHRCNLPVQPPQPTSRGSSGSERGRAVRECGRGHGW
eukprot:scaffold14122_cov101-Isochrysis_galbana.AAC.2